MAFKRPECEECRRSSAEVLAGAHIMGPGVQSAKTLAAPHVLALRRPECEECRSRSEEVLAGAHNIGPFVGLGSETRPLSR